MTEGFTLVLTLLIAGFIVLVIAIIILAFGDLAGIEDAVGLIAAARIATVGLVLIVLAVLLYVFEQLVSVGVIG